MCGYIHERALLDQIQINSNWIVPNLIGFDFFFEFLLNTAFFSSRPLKAFVKQGKPSFDNCHVVVRWFTAYLSIQNPSWVRCCQKWSNCALFPLCDGVLLKGLCVLTSGQSSALPPSLSLHLFLVSLIRLISSQFPQPVPSRPPFVSLYMSWCHPLVMANRSTFSWNEDNSVSPRQFCSVVNGFLRLSVHKSFFAITNSSTGFALPECWTVETVVQFVSYRCTILS